MQDFDQRDRELLHIVQTEIPIASTPFAFIGQMIEMSEKEVIKRVVRLKQVGVISQIRAIFDSHSLGYQTSLVAARVEEERIEEAAKVIDAHPGVSQNYQRNHDLNLWFTISVPSVSSIGLEKTIEILTEEAGCDTYHSLPALKIYRSTAEEDDHVQIDDLTEDGADLQVEPLSDDERACIVALQDDLPVQPRPFDAISRMSGLSAELLLETADKFRKASKLKRLAAIVQSTKGSFSATALGIFAADPARVDAIAGSVLNRRGISQCSIRPTSNEWPFNLFSVVHGRSVDECETLLRDVGRELEITQLEVIFPVREFKKTRITLFSPQGDDWEKERRARVETSAAS